MSPHILALDIAGAGDPLPCAARSSQHIRVLAFARFEDTLSVLEKASELTRIAGSTFAKPRITTRPI